jgi:hypothetical protein
MLEERCLFLLALKKEQAIDEYYRQVGGGWLFCGEMSKMTDFPCLFPKNLVSLHAIFVYDASNLR